MPGSLKRAPGYATSRGLLLGAGLSLGCGSGEPDAAWFARALDAAASDEEAHRSCQAIRDPAMASECFATLVRARPSLPAEACVAITDPVWSGECWFTIGERRAAAGDRWGALEACGQASAFYDECLYHSWTAELGAAAAAAPDAVSALERGRDAIAFWSDLQTIEGEAEDQLWGDFWYFAHNAIAPPGWRTERAWRILPRGPAAWKAPAPSC